MKKLQFMKFNKPYSMIVLGCILCIFVISVLFSCVTLFSRKKTQSIQNQIQSIEHIQVHAEKTRMNDTWTSNISEIWFSEEVEDGRVDIEEACARYGMTEADIRSFSANYSHYAVVDIPLRIDNASDVTISGFQISFASHDTEKAVWLYSGYCNGFYTSVEPGMTMHCTAQALVNLSACPIHKVDERVQNNGLKLLLLIRQ